MLKLYKVRYLQRNHLTGGEILRNKTAIFILGSAALCLLVVGCGSSGGDNAEGQPIDKATFAKRADTICEQASGKLAAEVTAYFGKEAANESANTEVILVKKVLIPGLAAELEELRKLGPPSEGKGEVQAFFKSLQKIIKTAEADPQAFSKSVSPYEGAELAGRHYGISVCPIAPVEAG
jgi:hypothetical protein